MGARPTPSSSFGIGDGMATKLDVKAMAALVSALQWIYERAIDGVPGLEGAPWISPPSATSGMRDR